MGGSMAGSMAGSMTEVDGDDSSPLAILGIDNGTIGCTAWWGGDSYELGTPPDVSDAANQANPGNADVDQAVEASRLHLVTVNGRDGWQSDGTRFMEEVSAASPDLWDAGDHVAAWFVERLDVATQRAMVEVSTGGGGANNGMVLQYNGTAWLWQAQTTNARDDVVSAAYSDTTNLALLHMRTGTSETTLEANGVATTAGTGGGMKFAGGDNVFIGKSGGSVGRATYFDFVVYRSPNPIAASLVARMESYFSDKYTLGL